MTARALDLDALDREVAEFLGWQGLHATGGLLCGVPPGRDVTDEDEFTVAPKFTRSWSDFGALLTALAAKGYCPMVRYSTAIGGWWGSVADANGICLQNERADSPMVALALSVRALKGAGR